MPYRVLPAALVLAVIGEFAVAQSSPSFATPEAALRALEDAYRAKDIEAAVAAKDFKTEALLMLAKINPEWADEKGIISETSEALELSFRKEIQDNGFPDFSGVTCDVVETHARQPNLVALTETCQFPDGGTSRQILLAAKSDDGWRIVGLDE